MEYNVISLEEYETRYKAHTVFDTAAFARLNAHKAEKSAVIEAGSAAIILGLRDNIWRAPFSAPYSLPAGEGNYDLLAAAVYDFSKGAVKLVCPPPFYKGAAQWAESLSSLPLRRIDEFNYHYPLTQAESFLTHMRPRFRRYFRNAVNSGMSLQNDPDLKSVYDFIAMHHASLGYHMAMTGAEVLATSEIIKADAFTALYDGKRASAEYLFHSAEGIVQAINTGDDRALTHLRPTLFMDIEIFRHYSLLPGMKIVDMGPSSTDGIRNEGLISFKLGLGCIETIKPTFTCE